MHHEDLDLQGRALTLLLAHQIMLAIHGAISTRPLVAPARLESRGNVSAQVAHSHAHTHTKKCLRSAHQNTLAIHGAFTCHTKSRTQTRHWLAREATPRASHLKLSTPSSESHNISSVRHQRPQAPQASSPPQGHPQ